MSILNTVFRCSFLRYNMLLCTACLISSRKIMSILCFVLFLLPVVIYFHISDKLVIALWPRTILANIFLVSRILLLFHSPGGSWNKWKNSRNSGNIYHIVLGPVPQLVHILDYIKVATCRNIHDYSELSLCIIVFCVKYQVSLR